jgi:GLPGLI family protein
MPKEITITAWYCPEIPVSHGPEEYNGLPGLIMEVTDGKTILLCSSITLNVKEKVEIKAPTNGSKVTQKEYDEIVMKKMQEFSQSGGGNGRGVQFRGSR